MNPSPATRLDWWSRVAVWHVLAGASAIAIVGSALRAATGSYTPISDAALFEARALDVFSRNPPLLGMYSTARTFAKPVFHPGPLLFDLLAIPVRFGAHGQGVAIGMGLVSAVVVVAIPWVASRFLDSRGAAIVAAIAGVMIWTLGPELLIDPFPAHAAILPFLLFLVSAWGWTCGHDRLAIVTVAAYSLASQTHGSAFVVGSGVLVGAIVIRLLGRRRAPLRRGPLLIAVGVLAVLWVQPVAQQFFGRGPGNFGEMLGVSTQGDRPALGLARALKTMASVLVAPPWWTRPGFDSQLPESTGSPGVDFGKWSLTMSVVGLVVLAALIVAGTRLMRRRGDEFATPGALNIAVCGAWGLVYLSRLPLFEFFGFMGHTARWLWPLGAFVAMFAVTGAARHIIATQARAHVVAASVAVGALAIAAMPWSHSAPVGPMGALRMHYESAALIRQSLSELEGQGLVLVEGEPQLFDVWMDTILADLARRGIPYVVTDPYRIVQLGDARAFDGDADIRVRVVTNPWEVLPATAEVLAVVPSIPRPDDVSERRWRDDPGLWADYTVRIVAEPAAAED